jgi:hypothetical protein
MKLLGVKLLPTLDSEVASKKYVDDNSGGGVFEWSTTEQVWPFEKDINGNTLYCKEVDLGALPNSGTKNVAHGITGLDQFWNTFTTWRSGAEVQIGNYGASSNYVIFFFNATNCVISSSFNATTYTGRTRLIYSKT